MILPAADVLSSQLHGSDDGVPQETDAVPADTSALNVIGISMQSDCLTVNVQVVP